MPERFSGVEDAVNWVDDNIVQAAGDFFSNLFGRRLNAYWSETSHNQYRNLISGDAVVFGGDGAARLTTSPLGEDSRAHRARGRGRLRAAAARRVRLKTLHTEGDSYYAGTSYLTRQFVPRTRYHPYIASAAYGQFVAANSGGTFSGETDKTAASCSRTPSTPRDAAPHVARRAARAAAVAAAERAVAAAAVAAVGAAERHRRRRPSRYSGAEGHASLLAEVRVAHEAACTSVYWQTSADRCDALAVALTQRVRYVAVSPPSPPPAAPDVLARGAAERRAVAAGSGRRDGGTNGLAPRRPLSHAARPAGRTPARGGVDDVVGDGYAWPPGYVVDRAAWAALPLATRAACIRLIATAPAPCVSAVIEANDASTGAPLQAANGERPTRSSSRSRPPPAAAPRQPVGLELVEGDTPELAGQRSGRASTRAAVAATAPLSTRATARC